MTKSIIVMITALALAALAFAGCSADADIMQEAADTAEEAAAQEQDVQTVGSGDFGSIAALEKGTLTVEEMLIYAIQDEYMAKQTYEAIMEEFGEQKPFSNIIQAEITHRQWLTELFEKYGYDIPEDNSAKYVVLPASIEDALELGVRVEINNIAMYEKFLEQDMPDDVRDVLIELRDASQNHLTAFEKGPRGTGAGNGSGNN